MPRMGEMGLFGPKINTFEHFCKSVVQIFLKFVPDERLKSDLKWLLRDFKENSCNVQKEMNGGILELKTNIPEISPHNRH